MRIRAAKPETNGQGGSEQRRPAPRSAGYRRQLRRPGSDHRLEAVEVADRDRTLAEFDQSGLLPGLQLPVHAFPSAADDVSQFPLGEVDDGAFGAGILGM